MFGNQDLTDEVQFNKFVKGKTTRQLAVMGLMYWNSHTKECAKRWRTIQYVLISILVGVGIQLVPRIGELLFDAQRHNLIPTSWPI